jgi:site-specific DNA-methyltransferase (adenine-specific)
VENSLLIQKMKEFNTDLGVAFNADCFEVMKMMPDGCVDMILADLPYGTTACKWDTVIPFEKLWPEFNRICKPNAAMVFTASQPFTSALVMSNVKNFRHSWVWDKKAAANVMLAKFQPLKIHEDILIFSSKRSNYFPEMTTGKMRKKGGANRTGNDIYGAKGKEITVENDQYYPKSIIETSNAARGVGRFHPTQKPVALFDYLIKTYTNEGDMVFDPTAGSLTTAVAAQNLNRRWVVCEMDEGYFDKGVARL